MLKYPCLVLDHDDTVVQSEATINYPYFCYILDRFRPGKVLTFEEYTLGCCQLGFLDMCRKWYGFTEAELQEEYLGWKAFIRKHTPAPYPGIQRVIQRQKAEGGLICVVSHSNDERITRDYLTHFGILPDRIYSCDLPEDQQKPNPYPLEDIMRRFQLTPGQLLVVDDMLPGCEMAKRAQVPAAFAAWSRTDFPQLQTQMAKYCDFSFPTTEALEIFLFE